jgi:hypothetical protein
MKIIRYAMLVAATLVLPACNDEIVGPTAPVHYPVVAGPWQGNVSYQARAARSRRGASRLNSKEMSSRTEVFVNTSNGSFYQSESFSLRLTR